MKKLPTRLDLKFYKGRKENPSGIVAYQNGGDFIILKFGKPAYDGKQVYFYDYESAGKQHVEKMKELALKGIELNTYKNQHGDIDYSAYWDDKKKRFELRKELA